MEEQERLQILTLREAFGFALRWGSRCIFGVGVGIAVASKFT